MNEAAAITRNTLVQGVAKIATLVFSLATTALLTRFLGKAGYGDYIFLVSFILIFATMADWGTSIIAVREASGSAKFQKKIFGTAITLRLLVAIIAFFLVNIVIRLNPNWQGFVEATFIASFILLFLSIKTSLNIIFQTRLQMEKAAAVEVLGAILFFIFIFAALTGGGGLSSVMFAWVGSTLMAVVVGIVLVFQIAKLPAKFDIALAKRLLFEAAPMGALLFTFSLYNRADVLILEHFQGPAAVGVYGLSYKVHENLVLAAAFLMIAAFPILVSLYQQAEKERLKALYQKLFDFLVLGGVFLVIIVQLAAPLIVDALAAGFTESVVALRILIFATFVSFLNHLTGYSLVAFGKQRTSLLIALGALILNITLNFLFIPLFSWKAAAVVTFVTEGFVLLLSSIFLFKLLGFSPQLGTLGQTTKELVGGKIRI